MTLDIKSGFPFGVALHTLAVFARPCAINGKRDWRPISTETEEKREKGTEGERWMGCTTANLSSPLFEWVWIVQRNKRTMKHTLLRKIASGTTLFSFNICKGWTEERRCEEGKAYAFYIYQTHPYVSIRALCHHRGPFAVWVANK